MNLHRGGAGCWLLLALMLIPPQAVRAASVEVAEAPGSEYAADDYARLLTTRNSLDATRRGLEHDLAALAADCSRVPASDTGRVAACRGRQQDLLARIGAYKAALAGYRADLAASRRRSAELQRLDQEIRADHGRLMTQVQRLMDDADVVSDLPPGPPHHVHEGVLLGLTADPAQADALVASAVSPFSDRVYAPGEVLTTTDAAGAREALRGLLDNHYLGAYTLSTPHGRKLLERVAGTRYDRLLAHSNGATVAEALIRRGVIQVDELNVIGGDRSMINGWGLQELIDSGRVKRVVVWINPGDIVPLGSSSAFLSPFGPSGSFPLSTTAQYFTRVLSGERKGGDSKVEYRFLEGSQYEGQHPDLSGGVEGVVRPHALDTYLHNIRRFLGRSASQ